MDSLTILFLTHPTKKVDDELSPPPSTELLSNTIDSVENKMNLPEYEKKIIYNMSEPPTKKATQYFNNLYVLAKKRNASLITLNNDGVANALNTVVPSITTDYILFIEHDWEFIERIDVSKLVDIMNSNKHINLIRFPSFKIDNSPGGGWIKGTAEEYYNGIPLTRNNAYSNHPHLVRTGIYKQWLCNMRLTLKNILRSEMNPSIIKRYLRYTLKNDPSRNSAEHIFQSILLNRLDKLGFDHVSKKYGLYLYGGMGDGPSIMHRGGR